MQQSYCFFKSAVVLIWCNTGCAAICTGLYIYYSLWNPVSGIYNRWNASDSCGQKPDLFHDLHACGRNYQHDFRPVIYFTFNWGIKGAAWATVIGQFVSGLLVIIYFVKFRKMELRFSMLRPRVKYMKAIAALGMASCINQIAMAIVQITMNNTLRHYGEMSVYGTDIPLACVGIISKVNMVFMAICIGISQGCQPIWGFNYGAGSFGRVRKTFWRAFEISVLVGVVFFIVFQIFPHQLVAVFGDGSTEYFQFAERYFRIFMFMTFINGIQPMSSGFFTSIGKARLGIVVSLTRQVLFLLPLILIFPLFMGIDGVMYAGPIADAAAAVVAIFYALRELNIMKNLEKKAV